jgi:hypothetical protein
MDEKHHSGSQHIRSNNENAVLLNHVGKEGKEARRLLESKDVAFSKGITGLDVDKPILQVDYGKFGYDELRGLGEIKMYLKNKFGAEDADDPPVLSD